MSETAPTPTGPKTDERAELARLEARVEKKRFEVKQNEAFGKYDEFIGPLNRSDDSHHSYHEKRPSVGIVRDGSVFRQAEAGVSQFASTEDYEAQRGGTFTEADRVGDNGELIAGNTVLQDDETSAARYYDSLIGGDVANEVAPEADYASMNIHQLAIEAANATQIGDKAEVEDIRSVLEHRLLDEVTRPGTEMTEDDYHAEMERFYTLMQHAVENREAKAEGPGSKNESQAAAADVAEANAADNPADPNAVGETTEAGGAALAAEAESQEGEHPEHAFGAEVTLNGEHVIVVDLLTRSDGTFAYEVARDDGSRVLAYAGDLELGWAQEETVAVEEAVEKTPKERLKDLWSRGKDFIAEKFTMGYMEAKWFVENSIINSGVDPLTTSFEDAEKLRNRNRTAVIAGAAALLLAAIASNNRDAIGDFFTGIEFPTVDTGPVGGETSAPDTAENRAILDALKPEPALVDEAVPVPEAIVPNEAFNIPSGGGAEQLFNRLNINPSKWYANQESFLANFPKDFYRMDGGGVGIAHPGYLSQGAQEAINALK